MPSNLGVDAHSTSKLDAYPTGWQAGYSPHFAEQFARRSD